MELNFSVRRNPRALLKRRTGELLMIAAAVVFILPVYYLIVTTFKTPADAVARPLGLPSPFTLDNYTRALDAMNYWQALGNNALISFFSVAGIVLLSAAAAYTFARRNHRLNRVVYGLFLIGMMVPYQMGILSLYRLVIDLGLMNTLTGVVLIEICYGLPFTIFLFRGFIASSVPVELEEAAKIDGCGVFRTFVLITFPLLIPVVATTAILNTLGTWNDFMTPLLFLQSREKGVLLLEVFRNIGQFSINWTNVFPMIFLAVAPLLVFYLFMQKFIIEGLTAGSIKG